MLRILSLLLITTTVSALFFGGGGGGSGCCCGCGTPQPASCGCSQPACPAPAPCPVCPPPAPCPPPPAAYCPQVSPVYVPSCQGSTCGGSSYAQSYSSGGCGGGGGGCGGGGYASSGGGYAASEAGGGYSAPVQQQSYAGPTGGGYAGPTGPTGGYAGPTGPTHAAGGGYAGNANSYDAAGSNGPDAPSGNYVPPLNQAFRNPTESASCDTNNVKYIVLRSKKRRGNDEEIEEEEMEEVERPVPLEATAAPLEIKELNDDVSQTQTEVAADDSVNISEQARARGTPTFTDAKCNSKPLHDLILENIVREDALATKRQIHEASLKKFPDHTVDIICSGTGFTYLVSTTEHCEAQKDNVICFVYKRPL